MMEKKLNWQLTFGLVIFGCISILKQFVELPEFICGLGYGLSISLEVYGMMLMKRDMTKVRNFKRKLIGLKDE